MPRTAAAVALSAVTVLAGLAATHPWSGTNARALSAGGAIAASTNARDAASERTALEILRRHGLEIVRQVRMLRERTPELRDEYDEVLEQFAEAAGK